MTANFNNRDSFPALFHNTGGRRNNASGYRALCQRFDRQCQSGAMGFWAVKAIRWGNGTTPR